MRNTFCRRQGVINIIYLDNAATSYPKPDGMDKIIKKCIEKYSANPGRSGHRLSMETAEQIYKSRNNLAAFFNIKEPSHLIFTKNTTEGLNMALLGILKEGDHVVTTSMEHNSVIRPLHKLSEKGVCYSVAVGNQEGRVACEKIENEIKENTKLICVTGASNVTGNVLDLELIGQIAAKHNVPLMVDGAQIVGSRKIDVERMNISVLAFPGHKSLLGPMGSGGLYVKPGIVMSPLLYGGTGTASKEETQPEDYPEGYEAGTVNTAAIIGLSYSVELIKRTGIDAISDHEMELIKYFDEEIDNMKHVRRYGPDYSEKTGISLINIEGMDCEEVASLLSDEHGIAVRAGFHCSGWAHKTIGTKNTGAIRFSVGPFNELKDMKYAVNAVYKLTKRF